MEMTITRADAERVLSVIDHGLSRGVGWRTPGKMCVEAAVCYALGLPHGDDPDCVSRLLRQLKIGLNDCAWLSRQARARGLRRLGLAQLGSRNAIDDVKLAAELITLMSERVMPRLLRLTAHIVKVNLNEAVALMRVAKACEAGDARDLTTLDVATRATA